MPSSVASIPSISGAGLLEPYDFFWAARDGDLEKAKSLFNAYDTGWRSVYWDETPLMGAASRGQLEVVKWLIPQVDVNVKNSGGETALFMAVTKGHINIVERLLEVSTLPDALHAENGSAIAVAAQEGYTDSLKMLLPHGDPNDRACHGGITNSSLTALQGAVLKQSVDCVRVLIAAGAEIDARVSLIDPVYRRLAGATALMLAIERYDDEIAKLLIHAGADVMATLAVDSLTLAKVGTSAIDQARELANDGLVSYMLEQWARRERDALASFTESGARAPRDRASTL